MTQTPHACSLQLTRPLSGTLPAGQAASRYLEQAIELYLGERSEEGGAGMGSAIETSSRCLDPATLEVGARESHNIQEPFIRREDDTGRKVRSTKGLGHTKSVA